MAPGTATAPHEQRFDAGRPCLDLLATAHPVERLHSLPPLYAWITASGLVPQGTLLPSADLSWVTAFRELRGCVRQLVHACLAPDHGAPAVPALSPALARLNDLARAATPAPVPYAVKTAPSYGGWTRRRTVPPCSPSLRGTRSSCSPTRSRGPRCGSARGTTARWCTSTRPAAAADAGAPARSAGTASGSPGTAGAPPSLAADKRRRSVRHVGHAADRPLRPRRAAE